MALDYNPSDAFMDSYTPAMPQDWQPDRIETVGNEVLGICLVNGDTYVFGFALSDDEAANAKRMKQLRFSLWQATCGVLLSRIGLP